jgi:hypothetical protein
MRWLTLTEVAEHLLEEPVTTVKGMKDRGELDGIVTKARGHRTKYHPECAWYWRCTGTFAPDLDAAYEWAERHPLPDIPDGRGARLVTT